MLPAHRACVRSATTTIDLAMPPISAKRYPSGPHKIRANCHSRYAGDLRDIEAGIAAFVAGTGVVGERRRAPQQQEDAPAEWQ
jgi:hypothetical protein